MKIINSEHITEVMDFANNNYECIEREIYDIYEQISDYLEDYFSFKLFKANRISELSYEKSEIVTSYINTIINDYNGEDSIDLYEIENYEMLLTYLQYMSEYILENNITSFENYKIKLDSCIKDKDNIIEYLLNKLIFNYVTERFDDLIESDEENKVHLRLDFLRQLNLKQCKANINFKEYEIKIKDRLYDENLSKLYDELIEKVMNFKFDNGDRLDTYIDEKIYDLENNGILKNSIEDLNKKSLDILDEINNRFVLVDTEKYEIIEK